MDPLHIQDMFPKFAVNVSNTRGSANVLVVPLSHSEQQLPTNIVTEQVSHLNSFVLTLFCTILKWSGSFQSGYLS